MCSRGPLQTCLRHGQRRSASTPDACWPALDDVELVRVCCSGDDGAWRELVERFSRYVYAIIVQAFRLTDADAEDIFQDVFVRAYERLGTLRDEGAVRPWIGQLTRRACLDRLRYAARETSDETIELEDPVDELARLDLALAVRDALAELPEQTREILDRFFCRDQTYATIAGELGLPRGTIASRISRGLTALRQQMG